MSFSACWSISFVTRKGAGVGEGEGSGEGVGRWILAQSSSDFQVGGDQRSGPKGGNKFYERATVEAGSV
jgi:hypothetical protein